MILLVGDCFDDCLPLRLSLLNAGILTEVAPSAEVFSLLNAWRFSGVIHMKWKKGHETEELSEYVAGGYPFLTQFSLYRNDKEREACLTRGKYLDGTFPSNVQASVLSDRMMQSALTKTGIDFSDLMMGMLRLRTGHQAVLYRMTSFEVSRTTYAIMRALLMYRAQEVPTSALCRVCIDKNGMHSRSTVTRAIAAFNREAVLCGFQAPILSSHGKGYFLREE